MWEIITKILAVFCHCFPRRNSYLWFCTFILGIMSRQDKLGVTSAIRSLSLAPTHYDSLVKFLGSASWDIRKIRDAWCRAVLCSAPILRLNGCPVLLGDGVKQSKEGRHMPGVKRLAQESETQSKPSMIFGHTLGGIRILIGDAPCPAALPLSLRIHDGLQETSRWDGADSDAAASHVVRIVRDGCKCAENFCSKCFLVPVRYFLTVPALQELDRRSGGKPFWRDCQLVIKAKKHVAGWMPLRHDFVQGRGRKRKRGDRVVLSSLFETESSQFQEADALLYGKTEHIRYYHTDILWGAGLYKRLRFVLVEYRGIRSILACTDTSLPALDIIRAYGWRFRIEGTFRSMKQDIGTFAYHFWTKAVGRLDHFAPKGWPSPLESASEEEARERVLRKVSAYEMHMMASCIAQGILQILSGMVPASALRYQRSKAKARPSEANVMDYLRRNLQGLPEKHPDGKIAKFILSRQADLWDIAAGTAFG